MQGKKKNSNWGKDALCIDCSKKGYRTDIGKCKKCGKSTSSGAFNLCNACGLKSKTCQRCGKSLKVAK